MNNNQSPLLGRGTGEAAPLHLMLDLETASTRPDAAILSIAIVPFEPLGEGRSADYCYCANIDLTSCFLEGDHIDADTQSWWQRQSPAARIALLDASKCTIRRAITEAYNHLAGLAETRELVMYSRGIDFDFPILEHAIRKYVEPSEMPYKYWNKRDVRTILALAGVSKDDVPRVGDAHSAISDCLTQIAQVQYAMRKLKMEN